MLVDATMTIRPGMPVWPGDPEAGIRPVCSMENGDGCNVSELQLGTHTGTHIDAPRHYLADGPGVEALPLEALTGPCWVMDLAEVDEEIRPEHLQAAPPCDRLVLRTGNTRRRLAEQDCFCREFAHIGEEAARHLVNGSVRLVGIDYLSVERFGAENSPVHRILLKAGVVLVEGLDMRQVQQGWWRLTCLPLKIAGADGAPARALCERL